MAGENEEATSSSLLIAILLWVDYDFGLAWRSGSDTPNYYAAVLDCSRTAWSHTAPAAGAATRARLAHQSQHCHSVLTQLQHVRANVERYEAKRDAPPDKLSACSYEQCAKG